MWKIIYGESYMRDEVLQNLENVKEAIYDKDRYRDNNYDSILEVIDENNGGWSYGDRSWSATEILGSLDEDFLSDIVDEEAEYRVSEDMPYEYDDRLESMRPGEIIEVYETNLKVEKLEDEIEENEDHEMMAEAANLL